MNNPKNFTKKKFTKHKVLNKLQTPIVYSGWQWLMLMVRKDICRMLTGLKNVFDFTRTEIRTEIGRIFKLVHKIFLHNFYCFRKHLKNNFSIILKALPIKFIIVVNKKKKI